MFWKKKRNKIHPQYFSAKAMKERDKKDERNILIGLVCCVIFLGVLA